MRLGKHGNYRWGSKRNEHRAANHCCISPSSRHHQVSCSACPCPCVCALLDHMTSSAPRVCYINLRPSFHPCLVCLAPNSSSIFNHTRCHEIDPFHLTAKSCRAPIPLAEDTWITQASSADTTSVGFLVKPVTPRRTHRIRPLTGRVSISG